MPLRYWIILIAVGSAFGVSFSLNEVLLRSYGPVSISAIRVTLGAVGCWAWVLATGRSAGAVRGMLIGVLFFGIVQYAAPFALLPLAQEGITSSVAGIANALTPVAVVVISHMCVGGERASPHKIAGVLLGLAGVIVLATYGAEAEGSDPRYIAVAIGAPICYAAGLNMVRRFRGLDPVILTAWAMTGGAAGIVPVALMKEGMPVLPDASTILPLAILGFGLTSAGFLVMYSMLARVGATNLSLVTFVAPLSAMLIGAIALGEPLGAGHIGGFTLILAGLFCIDGRLVRAISAAFDRTPARG